MHFTCYDLYSIYKYDTKQLLLVIFERTENCVDDFRISFDRYFGNFCTACTIQIPEIKAAEVGFTSEIESEIFVKIENKLINYSKTNFEIFGNYSESTFTFFAYSELQVHFDKYLNLPEQACNNSME